MIAPPINGSVGLFAALGLTLAGMAVGSVRARSEHPRSAMTRAERHNWTTPPLEALPPPPASRARRLALVLLRLQLLIAATLLLTKLVQLGVGFVGTVEVTSLRTP